MWKILSAIVFLCIIHEGFGETGCPHPDDIEPCWCETNPRIALVCQDFTDAEALRKVFINSERYSFIAVHIQHSTLQYLPYNIFENVNINQLYLVNVTLSNMFDRKPKASDDLRELTIRHTRVMRGIIWQLLEPFKGLRLLEVFGNPIRVLGRDFSKYVTKNLEVFSLDGTKTKVIKPGTFANFTKIWVLSIQNCELTTLTRDIFPTPFQGNSLHFTGNKISKIPDGLFRQMPALKSLSLGNNNLARLQKEAFDSAESVSRLSYLDILDNPIKCDCLLAWLMDVKPVYTFGRCAGPKRLEGRLLKDLRRSDFNC